MSLLLFPSNITLLDAALEQAGGALHLVIKNEEKSIALLKLLLDNQSNLFLTSDETIHSPTFCKVRIEVNSIAEEQAPFDPAQVKVNARYMPLPFIEGHKGLIIFLSSGSTGNPKFVVWNQRDLIANAIRVSDSFGLTGTRRVLIAVPGGHMYGFGVGILPSLLGKWERFLVEKINLIELFSALHTHSPDITLVTPSVCKMMLMTKVKFSHPRLFVSAGDTLQPDIFLEFEERFGKLINIYGSTELGAVATSPQEYISRTQGLIRALDGIEISSGAFPVGEIQVRDTHSFLGYLAETEGSYDFVQRQKEFFQTKDLAEWQDSTDSREQFRVIGRLNYSVNRYGFLTTFNEMERQLHSLFPMANEIIVTTGVKETLAGKEIIAWFDTGIQGELTTCHIWNECRRRLARNYIPDQIIFIDRIPRLPNGKPDRIALQATTTSAQFRARIES